MPTRVSSDSEEIIRSVLQAADVRLNGDRPWDIRVHDERLYDRVIGAGSLGLGEAYMDGWWDCDKLDELFFRLLRSDVRNHLPHTLRMLGAALRYRFTNQQTPDRSLAVAERHYNLGNDFYAAMLDPYMQYSCGYFATEGNLASAQRAKLDLLCRKLQLTESDHVLDIGCGWGGFAKYAAEHYGCRVTGVNISSEQVAFARMFCAGLTVEIVQKDYRDVTGTFDKIVSVGMFEHVGPKNYRAYMETARRCLKDDGIFVLHSIGANVASLTPDPWIARYIFPHSVLPGFRQIPQSADDLFALEDWHNFGASYDKTLLAWHANVQAAWPRFRERYGERFERMWRYYLLSCAGSFRARHIQLWQIVLTPRGMLGGFPAVR